MNYMDADLEKALEASAAEARAVAGRQLLLPKTGANDETPIGRTAFNPPLDHHFESRGGHVAPGVIIQAGVLDQFHADYAPLITKYGTAGSICGYVTAVHVKLLMLAVSELAAAEAWPVPAPAAPTAEECTVLPATATAAEACSRIITRLLRDLRDRATMLREVDSVRALPCACSASLEHCTTSCPPPRTTTTSTTTTCQLTTNPITHHLTAVPTPP
jgi:hypothetical protein